MVSTRVFNTDFNNGLPSNANGSIPFQFSGFVKTEGVQGYNSRGSGSNVFSGLFLRNDSGGNVGGGGNPGDPQIRTTLTINGLPTHNSIDLNFLLAVIDSWDGTYNPRPAAQNDFFNVTVDGTTIFSEGLDNSDTYNRNNIIPGDQTYTLPTGVFLVAGQFGFEGFYIDTAYNLGLDPTFNEIPHTSSNLTIQWYASGSGWQGGIDESWAIDNLEVIVNNNPPRISISDVTITEGNTGTKNAIFNVSLSLPPEDRVTVRYATSNGTAVAPSDYTSKQGTLTFNPGQTTQNIVIPIISDTRQEANETFRVNLSQPSNATISDSQGVATILNDDILPRLSINSLSVFEGNNRNNIALTVTLTGPTTQRVSANFATANGSAVARRDYVSKTGNVAFNPSNAARQTKTIQIRILGDSLFERDENFSVNLANAVNATLATSRGTVTLKNDDNRLVRNSLVELSAFPSLAAMTTLGVSKSSIIDTSPNPPEPIFGELAVNNTIF